MQENQMQNLIRINEVKKIKNLVIIEINSNSTFIDNNHPDINIQDLIVKFYNKNYLKIDEISNSFYILKLANNYYGPYLWKEEFSPLQIPAYIFNIKSSKKKFFLLKTFKLKFKKSIIKFKLQNNYLNILYLNKQSEIEQKNKIFTKKEIDFFIKQKIFLNRILNENPQCNPDIFKTLSNHLFETFFPSDILDYNTLYIFEIDKTLSSIPFELLNFILQKYNSAVIFNFNFLNNYNSTKTRITPTNQNSNKIDNLNNFSYKNENKKNFVYIYSIPEPFNLKKEINLISNIDFFDIIKIYTYEEFIDIINKYNFIIFSGHGFLKNNINTIIINNNPFPIPYLRNIKKTPNFIYFSTCLLTTGFFDNNIFITLLQSGLSESITTQFLINEKISFSFLYDFIDGLNKNIKLFDYPLINFLFSLFNNFDNFSFVNKYVINNTKLKKYSEFIL